MAEVLLEEQQQVVGEALENRMALLGLKRARPGFALAHLAFELVENVGAPILAQGLWIEPENIRKKPRGKLIINVLRLSHEKKINLTESHAGLKRLWRAVFGLRCGIST